MKNYAEGTIYKHGILTRSNEMKEICYTIERVAKHDMNVLICGETGTGKELVARGIHREYRKDKPFVAVNCAAIPSTLFESEMFGHTKGAYTGATESRIGKFKQADSGTLFLDEVGDLPFENQARLLRIIDDKEVVPVGASGSTKVDVRIVCATNKELETEVEKKIYNDGLYYRIAAFTLRLPPLRERKDDIAILSDHFLKEFSEEYGSGRKELSKRALDLLCDHDYPGNVRELQNLMKVASVNSDGEELIDEHLLCETINNSGNGTLPGFSRKETAVEYLLDQGLDLRDIRELAVRETVNRTNGNISEAAKRLNVSRPHIYKYLKHD